MLLNIVRGHIFYNLQANYYNRQDVYSLIGKYSKQIRDIHIWEKTNPMPASGYNITNAVEYFLVLGDSPLKSNSTYTKNIISTSVNSKVFPEHKAIMKLEVCEYFIQKFTSEKSTILDPFIGSGTTAIACLNTNRNYIGIEKEEKYVTLANDRIAKHLGDKE